MGNAVDALVAAYLFTPGWMRSTDPWFRNWDRMPAAIRERLAELKSDDLRNLRPDYLPGGNANG